MPRVAAIFIKLSPTADPRPEASLRNRIAKVSRYRHYRNNPEPGSSLFITTTVLDFVHAFRREEPRTAMALHLSEYCRKSGTALYAFVVMPHHVHLLLRLPETLSGPEFMRVLKRQSGAAFSKLLTAEELREFDQQRGLNRNTFWKYSFRSKQVEGEEMFWQKVHYIHHNPVRAGYVESPEEWRWSSAQLMLDGCWSWAAGLDFDALDESLGARVHGD